MVCRCPAKDLKLFKTKFKDTEKIIREERGHLSHPSGLCKEVENMAKIFHPLGLTFYLYDTASVITGVLTVKNEKQPKGP